MYLNSHHVYTVEYLRIALSEQILFSYCQLPLSFFYWKTLKETLVEDDDFGIESMKF